jgi:cyclopropane fatty-acyl-phospholipid synthase-like methyltransferase
MTDGYLRFYSSYSLWAPWKFIWDSLRAPSRIRGLSLVNRQRDYERLRTNDRLFNLHYRLNEILHRSNLEWKSYDYGEGYFYQSCPDAGITGLRDTEARIRSLGLRSRLKDRDVLEIGCNTGFLGVTLAGDCRSWTGFDINPFAIEAGCQVSQYLGRGNCTLRVSGFDDFESAQSFGAVLSFANHSTYDHNIEKPIREYFERCANWLEPGGLFLFESHPPLYERGGLEETLETLQEFFVIEERAICSLGSYLDRGRTFVAAVKK